MRLLVLLPILSLSVSSVLYGQDYSTFSSTVNQLQQISSNDDLSALWNDLVESEDIPFVREDSVAFLYRGEAKSVMWMGDFNGWGYNKSFNNKGTRVANTDLWILKASFPKDARLDYKILIDESNSILDPHNADHQWSGVGGGSPNSELRMPEWKPDPVTSSLLDGAKAGRVEKDLLMNSKSLGYQITYSVYIPAGYTPSTKYPVVYVTDGYEYMHDRLGNMVVILDNLIHLKKIQPVIAVFIDHREPVNRSNNRRMQELAMNEKYLNFITDELVATVEKNYSVTNDPSQRAVIGTSMGGLSAAYFAFSRPQTFGMAGIQSPAFWFRPEIYTLCSNPERPPVKTFMTTGMINDTSEGAIKMKALLDKNTCNYQFKEVNQGHSWGNWRDLIDDILIYFYPAY
jgi:enterochelin esterase-like enzyme